MIRAVALVDRLGIKPYLKPERLDQHNLLSIIAFSDFKS
jgi:hypothetical protein